MKKDDIVTLTIDDIGTNGEGIGRTEGITLFIKDAVMGDTVTAKIMKVKKFRCIPIPAIPCILNISGC